MRLSRARAAVSRTWDWLASPEGRAAPSSWPLDHGRLAQTSIRWPSAYEWPSAAAWAEPIRDGLARRVPVERAPILQPYEGVVLFQVSTGGPVHDVVIDYFDRRDLNPAARARAALYFKMQFSRGGYGSPHVVPGGYVPRSSAIYRALPRLRRERDRRPPRYDVYGRFGLDSGREVRTRAVVRLRAQRRFRYEGSLGLVPYREALAEAARAKVVVDLPGKGDLCFRLVDYLAIGACIVGPPHGAVLPVPLEDRRHVAYTRPDLEDLVDLCAYFLEHDDAREAMCRASRDYFDRYLHREQLGDYYLYQCLGRLA